MGDGVGVTGFAEPLERARRPAAALRALVGGARLHGYRNRAAGGATRVRRSTFGADGRTPLLHVFAGQSRRLTDEPRDTLACLVDASAAPGLPMSRTGLVHAPRGEVERLGAGQAQLQAPRRNGRRVATGAACARITSQWSIPRTWPREASAVARDAASLPRPPGRRLRRWPGAGAGDGGPRSIVGGPACLPRGPE